jgi:ABC-2 type transport system permease protein
MVIRVSYTMDDGVVPMKVRDGSISIDLIRPYSFFYMNLAESLGHSLFHFIARAVPILVASLFLFDLSVPMSETIFFFPITALLGYLLLFMLNYIIGMLAFWFIEIFPFLLFKYGLITIFSGGIIPIDFFPDKIKPLLELTPFPYILYAPTVILTGHATAVRAQHLILGQVIWVIILYFMCKIVWRIGRNKLLIQGG